MALPLGACLPRAEQPILGQFFAASRLRDLTALTTLSTVVFEPTRDGIVTTFTIVAVSVERRDGDHVTKDVTIDAPVRMPNGQTTQKTLIVTLQRAASKDRTATIDRWMVTRVRDASPAAATPQS